MAALQPLREPWPAMQRACVSADAFPLAWQVGGFRLTLRLLLFNAVLGVPLAVLTIRAVRRCHTHIQARAAGSPNSSVWQSSRQSSGDSVPEEALEEALSFEPPPQAVVLNATSGSASRVLVGRANLRLLRTGSAGLFRVPRTDSR